MEVSGLLLENVRVSNHATIKQLNQPLIKVDK